MAAHADSGSGREPSDDIEHVPPIALVAITVVAVVALLFAHPSVVMLLTAILTVTGLAAFVATLVSRLIGRRGP
jgi:hypothetical protein